MKNEHKQNKTTTTKQMGTMDWAPWRGGAKENTMVCCVCQLVLVDWNSGPWSPAHAASMLPAFFFLFVLRGTQRTSTVVQPLVPRYWPRYQ